MKKFVKSLLASPGSEAIVTTMIDVFKIPGDFPELAETSREAPALRVRKLEQHFTEDICDRRFSCYLQLHEFEALLLADLKLLVEQHPNRRKEISELAKRLDRDFESPEHVNRLRPPSYWIKDAVPEYNKTVDSPVTTTSIGLSRLREHCPHFGERVQRLEDLARA